MPPMCNHLPWAILFAATAFNGGCATLTNPVPDAIPVCRLPDEVLHACPNCPHCPTPQQAGGNSNEITTTKFQVKPGSEVPAVVNAVPVPPGCAGSECGPRSVFYTGGDLGSGEYPLTRDLRVTEAIAVAHGPLHRGMGTPSPSRVTVLRRLPTGEQLAIRVNLNQALRDPRENIPIWPGDMIMTRETACESTSRIFFLAPQVATRTLTPGTLP
jgi:hypothetical protein